MAKREFQALRPPLFALALLIWGATETGLGIMQAAEGAGIRTGEAPALLLNPDESESSAAVADAAPPALIFLPGDAPDYDSPDLCAKLGGTLRAATGGQRVCSSIDANDTFCIAGSADAFPCQGLYKHALVCNQYNRPALNPFFCGAKCAAGEFACGAGCARGRILPIDPIPYVGNYIGEVFQAGIAATLSSGRATVALPLGKARFRVTPDYGASSVAAVGTVAAVGITFPLFAGVKTHATLRADFSCGGLASSFSAAEVGFTITALAVQPVLTAHYEAAPGTWGTVTMTIAGINQLNWEFLRGSGLDIHERGAIEVDGERPSVGGVRLLVAEATSPDFLGEARVTARVEFHHPFSSKLVPEDCRAPSNFNEIRAGYICYDGNCPDLDQPLYAAVIAGDADLVCEKLRAGGSPYASDAQLWFQEGRLQYSAPSGFSLGIAARKNDIVIGRILMANSKLFHRHSHHADGNALNYAAYGGAVEFGRQLLETNYVATVATGNLGRFPAHALASRPHDYTVGDPRGFAELLTLYGATGNEEDAAGNNVLHVLASLGHGESRIIEPFLRAGVSVNKASPDFPYLTPLAMAAFYNHFNVASVLLNAPANLRPNVNMPSGLFLQVPISYARTKEMIDLLVGAGALLNLGVALDSGTHFFPMDYILQTGAQKVGGIPPELQTPQHVAGLARYLYQLGGLCANSEVEFPDICSGR